ncbi:hypothetical protein FGG33_gp50 [Mycobacterium phage Benedict]|uniref:Uncharacterized protein n=2 Tax=Benedictvirus TaxID=2946819 RepID=A0A0K1LIR7_9CAUD|nr:hypothetical protein AVT30_gp48 [Mycobacterium phage UnionJack]YP_009637950.1 hypothetical protein FGG33_gp50 [Mycobacterium phage Benedict]AEJ93470.1 hypothetical protein BENEDICT_47 [Mycobacterium phage Benedict]AKU42397.1 hypothetical protein UNIONJACK_45 [Mycobacterium phage UnionJack]AVR76996.1 hypothetical protein SEA_JABIRU_45 [Mycobacterium phage Jabiru]
MTAKFDPRIQIHLDYTPNLDHYPEHVTSKLEAFQFDAEMYREGLVCLEELISVYDVTVTVVEVKVPE